MEVWHGSLGIQSEHDSKLESWDKIKLPSISPQEADNHRLLGTATSRTSRNKLLRCRTTICNVVCEQRSEHVEAIAGWIREMDVNLSSLSPSISADSAAVLNATKIAKMITVRESLDPADDETATLPDAVFIQLVQANSLELLQVDEISEDLLDMLVFFAHVDSYSKVSADEFWAVSGLWKMYSDMKDEWSGLLEMPISFRSLSTMCSSMNHGAPVRPKEITWITELATECSPGDVVDKDAVLLALAYWYMTPVAEQLTGINRLLLIERLTLERRLRHGFARLLVWLYVFLFLTTLMAISSKPASCRGVMHDLESQFHLHDLKDITTLQQVMAYARNFSRTLQVFSPSSQRYFDATSDYMLLDGFKTFNDPVQLPEFDHTFGSTLTLQAWVKLSQATHFPHGGVPLLRKALGSTGKQSRLSCWSWNFPPSISFGAHDYGPSTANPFTSQMEEFIGVTGYGHKRDGNRWYDEESDFQLHTMVVSSTTVQFFVNDGKVLATMPLPRPLTDCDTQEIHMGAEGLEMAGLRYYHKALTSRDIKDIYEAGAPTVDIGFANLPKFLVSVEKVEQIESQLSNMHSDINFDNERSFDHIKRTAVLTASAVSDEITEYEPFITANHTITKRKDTVFPQYDIWQLYDKATYTNEESLNYAPGNALPPGGDGFTISAWLKFHGTEGQGYHIVRAMPFLNKETGKLEYTGIKNICWATYAGVMTSLMSGTGKTGAVVGTIPPMFKITDETAPLDWRFREKSWRHVVFRMDTRNESYPFIVCVDGQCPGEASIDNHSVMRGSEYFPPTADCSQMGALQDYTAEEQEQMLNASVIFLNRRPPNDWPFKGMQMSTKYYDRILSEREIYELFLKDPHPETGLPIQIQGGCHKDQSESDDLKWMDAFGHNCYWYFYSMKHNPEICVQNPKALKACPVACRSSEWCWGTSPSTEDEKSMNIWPMQMEFRSKGDWGVVCVGKSSTPEEEAVKCGKGVPSDVAKCAVLGIPEDACGPKDCSAYIGDSRELVSCLGERIWFSQDASTELDQFLPCKSIIELHDSSCDWDDSKLDEIASDIQKSQEWSISFWMQSLNHPNCVDPQIRLLDGQGNVFSTLGGYDGMISNEPGKSACANSSWMTHTLLADRPLSKGVAAADVSWDVKAADLPKHMVVFGRLKDGSAALHIDGKSNFEKPLRQSAYPPLQGNKNFLRIINIVGDIRMGAWTLKSSFPTDFSIGNSRLTQLDRELLKRGPKVPVQEQFEKIERTPAAFEQHIMLAMPAVVSQKRHQEGKCSSQNAEEVVSSYKTRNERHFCKDAYVCPDYDAYQMYRCANAVDDSIFFGLTTSQIGSETVYMDYLTSVVDYDLLARPGKGLSEKFIDTLTSHFVIHSLFFSVQTGILSNLEIDFSMNDGMVQASYDIRHQIRLKGTYGGRRDLQIISMAFFSVGLLILVAENLEHVVSVCQNCRSTGSLEGKILSTAMLDLAIIIISVIFLISFASSAMADPVIDQIMLYDWHRDADSAEIKKDFMEKFKEVLAMIYDDETMNQFAMYLSILLMLRLVMITSIHPRLAIITGVIKYAAAEFLHFLVIAAMVFGGFAAIGVWRWGPSNPKYQTFASGIRMQLDSVLGPPGDLRISADNKTYDYLLFALLFQVICFIFMLNFVLAITVNAYTLVMEEVEVCRVEQNIALDFYGMIQQYITSLRYRWPKHVEILHFLACKCETTYVGTRSLEPLFCNTRGLQSFTQYYSKFPFLLHNTSDTEDSGDSKMMEEICDRQDHLARKVDHIIKSLSIGDVQASTNDLKSPNGNRQENGNEAPEPMTNGRMSLKSVLREVQMERKRSNDVWQRLEQCVEEMCAQEVDSKQCFTDV